MAQLAPDHPPVLNPNKFRDPFTTAKGERRARVALQALETLWINTGTLCNLTCKNCYIESSPSNDRLVYLSAAEVREYLLEIERDRLPTHTIGFTGGEPFMNADLPQMLDDVMAHGLQALVLTNAMKPMAKTAQALLALGKKYPTQLTVRVSIDHYSQALHELERGPRSWRPTIDGLRWLSDNGLRVAAAARQFSGESDAALRDGFARLFERYGIHIDSRDPQALVIFPEMDASVDVPEITEACWGILDIAPTSVMCSSSRMVIKRKGEGKPVVLACTLLPYDKQFELGQTLKQASGEVALNHPHCAKFCVLGGAACSR
jgi:uncharacterized Fe-S cluster-containing radical SAM superfamily protein